MVRFTDEERLKKIQEVANYIIETNSSTRKTAIHFGISNATVSAWMNFTLKKIDSKKFLRVGQVLNKNKPKTIEDEQVRDRVLNVYELIKSNFTVEQIASSKGISVHIIYEDLQTRLPRISMEKYNEVKEILKRNSMKNLKNVKYEYEGIENAKRTK